MGKYNDRILAEFCPPRKWILGRDLSYTTNDLTVEEIKALQDVGVKVKRDTSKTETITVPTGFETDLASVPRALWAFIAPFDVARAAIIHDLLYKTIRQYRWEKRDEEDKELVEAAKRASDKVFLLAMNDSQPHVIEWKKYSAWKAVDLFGKSSIVPSKD
ncbi:uncharacterized protein METZ01_LOCUS331462 [marine metagenome]|uniref:DUF1353 domain-containing protein n=1 Tax=marine metagenome TaxID=408172 RepID=A0A382Q134_9ZZZZ